MIDKHDKNKFIINQFFISNHEFDRIWEEYSWLQGPKTAIRYYELLQKRETYENDKSQMLMSQVKTLMGQDINNEVAWSAVNKMINIAQNDEKSVYPINR